MTVSGAGVSSGPVFLLKLIRPDGSSAVFPGGGEIEADLVDMVVERVSERYLGLGRTQRGVESAVRDAVESALLDFKRQSVRAV